MEKLISVPANIHKIMLQFTYDITFIFDRGHCSWTETPDQYECDLKYLTYIFAESKISQTEI